MHSAAWFLFGFLLGWLLQWALSYFYFRRRPDRQAAVPRDAVVPATSVPSEENPEPGAPAQPSKGADAKTTMLPETRIVAVPAPTSQELHISAERTVPAAASPAPGPLKTFRQESVALPDEPAPALPDDDLTLIRGIGSTYLSYLQKVGVTTFAQLAAETPASLKERLDERSIKGIGVYRLGNWINEARSLTQVTGQALLDNSDLTLIHGIGNVYALRLRRAGIDSFRKLAEATPEQLQAAVKPKPWMRLDFEDWIRQAKVFADNR